MKTRIGICRRKRRFASREAAQDIARQAYIRDPSIKLRAYRCELCRQFHLTSRTKAMKTPNYELSQ